MSSYSSRHNRYYDSVRSSHGGNARSQSGNASGAPDDDTLEEISEDLQKILDDDSKCARLLRKIFREDRSFDLHLQRIQEFQTYLEKSDSNKFIMKLAQPALNSLFKQLQERANETIRSELARCIGLIGYIMLNENEPKFAEWIFERLNDTRRNDAQRQLLVGAFRRSLENEHEMLCLTDHIQHICEELKKILESVVHAPLMIVITDTIIDLSRIYPHVFRGVFVDIVDILIGWYIEPLPTDRILEYTAQALHKFRPFWLEQLDVTTFTLLDHFIEDADNYAQQFERHLQNNEDDTLSFTDKIASLYRAFATVLRALSDNFALTPNILPVECVDNWLQKILHTTNIIQKDKSYGVVIKNANTAVCILLETFAQHDESLLRDIFHFIIQQTTLKAQDWPYEADANLLRLIMKLIDTADHDSCASLAGSIFAPNSRLWLYRFLYSNSLIQDVLQLFNRLLTMKSIPVVQQVYQAILADMTLNFNLLLTTLEQTTILLGSEPLADSAVGDLNEDDAEAALIFDCSALCQIGNVKGNLFGLYALSPSLFELLAKHLQLTNAKLARQYPAIHYGVLKTLYSHCAAHEHFIHNSDLFKQNDTNSVLGLTGLNKDNFEDLLKLHHRLIMNSHLSCHDTKKLVLNWLAEIIDALPNEDNGLLTLPLLLKLSHAIIDIAYSDEEEICSLCCRLLNKIVKRQRDLDVSFLVRLFDLCRFWLQSNETSIHDSYYAILCCLPVNILTSKFPTHGSLLSSKNDYSGFASIVKRNHMITPYLGTFTTHCFNLILGYILVNHQMPRMYASTWLERLFQSCQRKSTNQSSRVEHICEDQHRLLSYEQLPNFGNDALIWFWAIWECAQFCVMNKLKTSLGKPQETFLALEETLRFFAWPMDSQNKKMETSSSDHIHRSSTPSSMTHPPVASSSSSSNEINPSLDKGDWWCDLHRCGLLLQLIEALEKCMYNAYEGAALALPALPKTVKFFFITNKSTCLEWLNRIRIPIILTAVRSGQYESAARNCNQYLMHVCSLGQAEAAEFEFVIISFVQSLIKLHNSMTIHGIYTWLKCTHQLEWSWILAGEHEAAGNLEQAAYEYKVLLNDHFKNLSTTNEGSREKISAALVKFLTQKVYDCYLSLHQWPELIAWNEACLKMQVAFLQDNYEDLRSAMETTIDMNAIRAMSCFENRDFEGLKSSMRKMPNSQATGEELGRSIACGWDMEAFDMLATVETLKGVSKRRSGLWSLNAVLQLTQDLTRIHNVDEHASWSEERAAISQVAALYQSENREVPLLPTLKFAPVQHSVRALNSVLLYSQPTFNNQSASSSLTSNWTSLRMGAARLARQQNNFTLASKLLIQQFQSSHNLPPGLSTSATGNAPLGSPLRSFHSESSSIESYSLASLLSMLDRHQNSHMVTVELETETAKLMHALSLNKANNINTTIAIEFLSRSILRHLINESQINHSYNNQRLLVVIEKCSRNLLHIAKWSRAAIEQGHDATKTNVVSLGKLFQLRKQYLHNGLGVDIAGEPFVRNNVPLDELLIGELLDFSTLTCPTLAKTWFRFADWTYVWGRQLLARSTPLSAVDLEQQVRTILPAEVPSDELTEICRILLSIRILNDDDSELTASELSSIHSYHSDLSRACSWLAKHPPRIDQLLALHPQFDLHRYFLLEQSCRAYFTYLQLSNTSRHGNAAEKKSNSTDEASNVLVTLRLLRVLVRYPQQLRAVFETSLVNMPTVAWKRIIPQLFSRLNHPEGLVRDYVTNLLIRIAKDFPQLILYSVIVGITDDSKMRRMKSRDENIYRRKSLSIHGSDEERTQDDNDEEDNEQEDDEEAEVEDDEEDDETEKQENVLAMQQSFRLLYNVLAETNAHVVGQVKLFVHELRRVTVLWDELWLGTMAQLQEEIRRRVDALKDELQRLESMTHLTNEEKEFLIKEKQDVLFKSFITVLEAVSQITHSSAETPREQTFQKDYSKQIDAAIEQLKQPISLSDPHACWLQLRQLYSMLHRTGKRSGTIHAMNQISPKLAQIKHSVIPIPGDDGQFHTIHSVGQTVQVLPTKTRPKKLMFVGSNGRRYQYLLKGLEDLHLDERIMQLLSIVNVMFTKINRNEPWSYEARNYTVIPLASRSGLIQWVEGATPMFTLYKRWQQRQATAQSWKAQNENQDSALVTVQKPNDVYYSKLNAILKDKGKPQVDDRREVPMPILRQCIEELIRETPEDLLSRELWCSCPSVGLWYKNVQNYSRSLAVTSMIGYMIGLGDRHLDNVLVDLKSGQIIHIDYNICFEKGKKLRVPEKIPYRLTQNLRHALGIAGLEGVFSLSSENVLRILRHGKEILLNLLESFIYDPLIDWTGHDTGVLAAFYGGQSRLYEQITTKKRQVEKDALLRMFHLRTMEMRQKWTNLGESIQRTMNKLLQRVHDISGLDQNLHDNEMKLNMMDKRLEYLKSALDSPSTDHALFSLPERRKKLLTIRKDMDTVKDLVSKLYQSLESVVVNSAKAHGDLQSKSFSDKLRDFVGNDHVLTNTSPVLLASDFLQTVGKSALLHQSEQLDNELQSTLRIYRAARQPTVTNVLKNLVDLCQYLPSDYVQSSSLTILKTQLNELQTNFNSERCQEFVNYIDTYFLLDPNSPSRLELIARSIDIDRQFAEYIQSLHQEINKISELQLFVPPLSSDQTFYRELLTKKLQGLDAEESSNYRRTLLVMLFDRWQHCRQMGDKARHMLNHPSSLDHTNETFIDEIYTLIRNTAYLSSLVQQNAVTMDASLLGGTVELMDNLEHVFRSMKNLLTNFEMVTLPTLIRGVCSKQSSLQLSLDMLNTAFKQIQPIAATNSSASVDDTCQTLYQQLRASWAETSNDAFDSFAALADMFDDLDHQLDHIYTRFETLPIPSIWLQSPLFDWKQTNMDKPDHRRFLRNFFAMSKIATLRQICQSMVDHSQLFENLRTTVTKDTDLRNIIQRFLILYIVQYLVDLPSLVTSYLILSLIPSASLLEINPIHIDSQFQELLANLSSITPTPVFADLQQLLAQINSTWQQSNNAEQIQTSLRVLRTRKHIYEMQLIAYRWRNFHLLRSEDLQQRRSIFDELTTEQSILAINDSTSPVIIEKMIALEQTVIQRLRWAAGANPLVQDVLVKFEIRQKERANEIDNDKQLCLHLSQQLQSWLLFEHHEEQIKLQGSLIRQARTFAEKGLEICQLKNDIEGDFSNVEQAILEFAPLENVHQITRQNLPSLIELAENDCLKQRRNRLKEEREMENRRDEASHLVNELKEHMSQHNTIFKDISSVLKSLLKVISHRPLQNYSNVHREFLELSHTIVKHTLQIDKGSSMNYDGLISKMKRVLAIKTKVFDELIQLNPTIDTDDREKKNSSIANTSTQQDKTTKVIEERNKYAVEICKRIRDKLDGSDPDPMVQSSISDQVRYTIREATDVENLATLYEGWTSWV